MGTGNYGVDQMKLVIGGAYQGKRDFLMQKWNICERETADAASWREPDDERARDVGKDTADLRRNESISMNACADCSIRAIVNYQDLIRLQMEQGLNPADELRQLSGLKPEIILCAVEIGMGIIPVDRKERDFRETCGRTLCLAAQMADEVWRVICGIGERIK